MPSLLTPVRASLVVLLSGSFSFAQVPSPDVDRPGVRLDPSTYWNYDERRGE
jgi:hypothetical protein